MDTTMSRELDEVRARHAADWDFIGKRHAELGWWASKEVRPGVTHHIVCRTLRELDRELNGAARIAP